MADTLETIVERYFAALRDIHRLGAGTRERSFYPALAELLGAEIGWRLRWTAPEAAVGAMLFTAAACRRSSKFTLSLAPHLLP